MKSCIVDIETTSLSPQTGVILLGCVLDVSSNKITSIKGTTGTDDKGTCVKLRDCLERYDIAIGYNILSFDVKFLQSRLLHWGEAPLSQKFYIDLLRVVRRVVPWSEGCNRSLANITEFCDIQGKTRIRLRDWLAASLDRDVPSLRQIELHCRGDVKITQVLFEKMKPHIRQLVRI